MGKNDFLVYQKEITQMNERIKELAKQATQQYSPTYYTQEWIQGFAELIVQECVHVAVYKNDGMISTADVAGYIAAGRASAAKIIKDHFSLK